jgi:hypothetical protein
VPLPDTAWCIPHIGVSYADHNSSRTGAITHNSDCGNSSNNSRNNSSSSSTVLLHYHQSRQSSGRHSSFPLATFPTSTPRRWATLLENATSPGKATHCELRHPWSINRGASRRVLHRTLATPTTPPWRGFPRKKKC